MEKNGKTKALEPEQQVAPLVSEQSQPSNSSLMHEFQKNERMLNLRFFIIVGIAGILGIGTGFLFSQNSQSLSGMTSQLGQGGSSTTKGAVVGSNDTKTFKDTTTGVLKEGGIEDEGQYHLVRPGGDSQNVYLTSSVLDLSQFKGKKVKVWGATHAAQKAGWLMDVGRVEVLE